MSDRIDVEGELASRAEGVEVWPVGPECARRVPARFRFRREDWDR